MNTFATTVSKASTLSSNMQTKVATNIKGISTVQILECRLINRNIV